MKQISDPPTNLKKPSSLRMIGFHYGLATLFVTVALFLSLLFQRSVPNAFVFLLLAAVMASAWFGRVLPGFFAVFLSILAAAYFFPPDHSFAVSREEIPYLASFVLSALVASWSSSARSAQRRQGAYLDELLEQAPEAVVLLDTHGRVSRLNKEFSRMFGYTEAEAVGRLESDLVVPEDRRREAEEFSDCLARGENVNVETVRQQKDGSQLQVSLLRVAISASSGQIAEYIIYRDITERKRAEKELALANDRLRLAMESAKAVGWDWDVKSGRDRWFGDLQTMFEIPSDTYSGDIEDFRRRIHPEDRGRVWKAVNDAMRSQKPYAAEFRIVRPDGTVRRVAAKGKFYYAPDGGPERMLGISVDVTERKLAETELALANDRLRLAMESAKAVGWDWDVKSGRDLWFGDLQTTFGIASDAYLGSIEELYRRIHAEDRGQVSKAVTDAMQSQEPYAAEFRVVRPDGTVRWLSNRGKFYYAPDGEPERMLGMAVDVTELKQAEESLTLFRKLIDGSNDAIEVIDPKTLRFLDMNEKACLDLGYSREELLSLSIFDIDPTRDESLQARVTQELRESGFVVLETSHRRKDGSTFPVEVNMKRVQLDREYIVAVVRDITERIQAEAALRESEERLRLAAEAGRMYAFEWNIATDVIVRSPECANILGWMDDPSHDTGQQFIARVHPADREQYTAAKTGLTPDNSTYQTSYRLLRPGGCTVWVEENGRALFHTQGKMLRVVGMVADVTARKQAEEIRQRREAELKETQHLGKIGFWRWDPETDTVIWSEELYRIAGRDPNLPAVSYKEHGQLYTPESWERLQRAVEEALRTGTSYELDLEMVQSDGTTRWLIARGEAVRDTTGRVVQLGGTVQDITERKQAERERLDLSARLITAQEEERSRIARELHDDLSQRLALLAIELHQLSQKPPKSSVQITASLRNLWERTQGIASDVHRMSSRLHPSTLTRVGLVVAIRSLCSEIRQHGIETALTYRDVPDFIPDDVSMCLFRIAQEALANVVKHSGAKQVQIELIGAPDHVRMRIADSGHGFDPASNDYRAGLGLLSMKERLRLVGGQFSIQNREGTEIGVEVPLPPAKRTMSA